MTVLLPPHLPLLAAMLLQPVYRGAVALLLLLRLLLLLVEYLGSLVIRAS